MFRKLLLILAAIAVSGCATITRGTEDVVNIETTPQGARCDFSTGHACASTPCAIKMKRKSEGTVTCSLPGYQDATATFTHKVAGAGAAGMAGNVIFGGIIGAGVDGLSGSMLNIEPNPIVLELEPEEVEL